jgi:multimeric flavodoxin WrbA
MKKVLIISTSLRKGGNSDMLAEQFAKGSLDCLL